MSEALADLMRKLDDATGPDRELDALIHNLAFGTDIKTARCWLDQERTKEIVVPVAEDGNRILVEIEWPAYTASIDDAQTIIPECNWWRVMGPGSTQAMAVGEVATAPTMHWDGIHRAHAPTAAIALCTAAMKARHP